MQIKQKSLAILLSSVSFLLLPSVVFAETINPCPTGPFNKLCDIGDNGIGPMLGNIIIVILVLASVIALMFLIWGGIKWIMSGGDKAKVETARGTIVSAVIGLIITFLAFFILSLVLSLFGLNLNNLQLPTLTLTNSATPTASVSATPTPDPIAGWQTYQADGFSFNYPADMRVEEREPNLFAVVPTNVTPTPTAVQGILIDARLKDNFTNYDTAQNAVQEGLINIRSHNLENDRGVKVVGEIGSGVGQGTTVTSAILHFRDGALVVQATDASIADALFDQLVSTVTFPK